MPEVHHKEWEGRIIEKEEEMEGRKGRRVGRKEKGGKDEDI